MPTSFIDDTRRNVVLSGSNDAVSLGLDMQSQQQTEWCWAAVAVSIACYYDKGYSQTQCQLVNRLLQLSDCCVNGRTSSCNRSSWVDLAIDAVGHLAGSPIDGPISFRNIVNEISHNRPVVARIGWNGSQKNGHFVVIDGYTESAGQHVWIKDPKPENGESQIPYSNFLYRYKGNGEWTHTFLTV